MSEQATPLDGVSQHIREEVRQKAKAIRWAMKNQPDVAMSVIEDALQNASSPIVQKTLERTFAPEIESGRAGQRVTSVEGEPLILDKLARKHAEVGDDERALLIHAATTQLMKLAREADQGIDSARRILTSIGEKANSLILDGAAHQLFFAELAACAGIRLQKTDIPSREAFVRPLIKALKNALLLGGTAMRHDAMEGIGALLKYFDAEDRKFQIKSVDTKLWNGEGDYDTNSKYFNRHRRHELIVRTIAGDAASRAEYFARIESPVHDKYGYDHRGEYLRALPAVCRQAQSDVAATCAKATELLCIAARESNPVLNASDDVEAAFARCQEAVFRTIDVIIDRPGIPLEPFDRAVAEAVNAIPGTLVGSLEACNARARATVALLCTAAKIAARLKDAHTDRALEPRYRRLTTRAPEWTNPGIMEGCLRGMPQLLSDAEHDRWTTRALQTLLQLIVRPPKIDDLSDMHARLCATSGFRSLLIALAERLHKQQMELETTSEQDSLAIHIEYAVRKILAEPSASAILEIFQKDPPPPAAPITEMPRTFAPSVVTMVAFSAEILNQATSLFDNWKQMPRARQLLLLRILGLQLQSASEARRELDRCEVLRKVIDSLHAVRLTNADRIEKLWRLLSHIPAEACNAADADLQDFVAYRSGRVPASDAKTGSVDDDLPEHVLEVASDVVSYRLAADIARQIDLNRYRERRKNPEQYDFAAPLYQVMLRGPNIAVFDHLLARIIDETDRQLLLLLRKHIHAVQECAKNAKGANNQDTLKKLKEHAQTLIENIKKYLAAADAKAHGHATVTQLLLAMRQFVALATSSPELWHIIIGKINDPALKKLFASNNTEDGGLEAMFRVLDGVAGDTGRRKALAVLCAEDCVQMRSEVESFLRLPVGKFQECGNALRAAISALNKIETKLQQAGLEPPEKHILLTLLQSWKDMFHYSIAWWVDAPRRAVEAQEPEFFWATFVDPTTPQKTETFPTPAIHIEPPNPEQQRRYGRQREPKMPLPPQWTQPPIPQSQRLAFERFYVEWMASQLDVENLAFALETRWGWFATAYELIRNWRFVLSLIAVPFLTAAIVHSTRWHEFEGVVFFGYLVITGLVTLSALVGASVLRAWGHLRRRLKSMWSHSMPAPVAPSKPQYRFQALLPRLLRLIVVPAALVVDFEHSYLFPMHASNAVLLILMVLAFLTTKFFIRRELRVRDSDLSRITEPARLEDEKRHVREIVSLALAHSFAVAILFSFIFESNVIARTRTADKAMATFIEEQGKHHKPIEGEAARFHHEPYFLGVIPREAECNLTDLLIAMRVPHAIADRMHFSFYPTLILTWTALGLFFGVFLEGFLKGERLRGETNH